MSRPPAAASVEAERFLRVRRLEIRTAADGSRRTLVLTGELDIDSSRAFNDALERELASGAQELILDLEAVDFIDSIGLHTLLRGRALAAKQHCGYFLSPKLPPRVQRMLTVAGVAEHLPFDPGASRAGGGDTGGAGEAPGDAGVDDAGADDAADHSADAPS